MVYLLSKRAGIPGIPRNVTLFSMLVGPVLLLFVVPVIIYQLLKPKKLTLTKPVLLTDPNEKPPKGDIDD